MNRLSACSFAVLFVCCTAFAQTSAVSSAVPPAASAATSTASPEIAQFQKIEDTWSNAVNHHDQYSLELVLSPLFVDVSAAGDITTRDQDVATLLSNDDKTYWLTQKVITVRMLGDIAVANGTYTLRHKVNSSPVDEKGVFTHVYERVRGGWLCINSQRTLLHEDSINKAKKSSGAEFPFHIPIFSRGDK